MNARLTTFAALTVALCATSASAAVLSGSGMQIAGQPDKLEFNIYLDTQQPAGVVSFDLTFQGEGGAVINNILGFGQAQTRESLANTPNQFDPNYKKINDSWLDDIGDGGGLNTLGFVVINPSEGPNLLAGGLATDVTVNPPQSFQQGRIAHFNVTAGGNDDGGGNFIGAIRVTGSIAVGNLPAQTINYSILLPFAEPASGTMTAIGLVAFAACRRRPLVR